jgi:hypothetical protein
MDRLRRIGKVLLIGGSLWVGYDMLTAILWPSRINLVPLVLTGITLLVWRRWSRREKVDVAMEYAIGRLRMAALEHDPAYQRATAIRHAQFREAERIANLRGMLAYDRETQENWNWDGTRKTPREQVVAKVDTYTFEVTEAKYRVMQEWFDDALEPGVYTFTKQRSGPERIAQ